ncbi:hypothetical protein D4740_04330 [Actinomyces sp. 2119]|uniref:hypothetical protein n=1 Tax=Actinomyces sp. 2119 TaxID=2321393 RepID=UPI000E6CD8A4|nr:hypothetical protein [Actinomyces sp. 2119]RJF43103.1 hypothetical protein D4740_04330 [Actinomyces sp. 2119]
MPSPTSSTTSSTTSNTTARAAPAGAGTAAPRIGRVRPLLTYILLETLRTLRHPANLFFVIAFPLVMFLVFSGIVSGQATSGADGDYISATIMLAMAGFSSCLSAASTASAAAVELNEGWGRQMALTPRGLVGYAQVKVLATAASAAVPVGVVMAAGALTTAQAPARVWVLGPLLCLVSALPFVLWGLAVGLWLPPQASVGIATSLVSLFGFLGNTFMPLSETLLSIGRLTPMYGPTALARWPLTHGWVYATDAPSFQDPLWIPVVNLVGWTLIFAALVALARHRMTVRR